MGILSTYKILYGTPGQAAIQPPQLQHCIQSRILMCMQATSVRVDVDTHRELKRLADEKHLTVGEAVRFVVRRNHQERIGSQLAADVTPDEVAWLDADLG